MRYQCIALLLLLLLLLFCFVFSFRKTHRNFIRRQAPNRLFCGIFVSGINMDSLKYKTWILPWFHRFSFSLPFLLGAYHYSPPQTFSFVIATILFKVLNDRVVMTSQRELAMLRSSLLFRMKPTPTTTIWTPFFFNSVASLAVIVGFLEIPSVITTRNFGISARAVPPFSFSRKSCSLANFRARLV